MNRELTYCKFYLGSMCFGVEVGVVQEVLRNQPVTKVPLAAPHILGLMNMRGECVMTIDLRTFLSLPGTPPSDPVNVVINTEFGKVSLVADRVGDVVTLDETAATPSAEMLSGKLNSCVRAVMDLDSEILLVLDETKLFESNHPLRMENFQNEVSTK